MIYQLLKAMHITAVITFVGGLLMLAVMTKVHNLAVIRAVRRWDRYFTTPALVLVWLTGLSVAIQGQWFGDTWLTIKLLAVIALSGLHGGLAGTLKRIEVDAIAAPPGFLRRADWSVIFIVAIIVFLVILKPAW